MSHPRPRATPATGSGAGARASSESSRSRLLVATLVGAGLLAVVLVVTSLLGQGSGEGDGRAAPVQVTHVHGLGVDPGDGALYAGTHHGLVRLPEDGPATLVGDRVQDFMGFTVVGENHYLASGHPGPGQGGPSSLGLIESTDGGRTWESVSLAGEADFHSLEARHGLVYGLDAHTGRLMVTADKVSWDDRGVAPLADLAISPESPDVILATTERGPVRSEDQGRSFQPVPGAPVLVLVSWADDGTVVGIEPDGTVQASTDGGRTWEVRGDVGSAPHALVATSGTDVYAAVDGAVLASSDGGRSFTPRHRE